MKIIGRIQLLFLSVGLVTYLVLFGGILVSLSAEFLLNDSSKKNISKYADFLIFAIGVPPETSRAQKLSDQLGLQIRIESDGFEWHSSVGTTPPIGQLAPNTERWDTGVEVGSLDKSVYLISEKNGYRFLFLIPNSPILAKIKVIKWILLLSLAASLGLLVFALSKALAPLQRTLNALSTALQTGDRPKFDLHAPLEFGELNHYLANLADQKAHAKDNLEKSMQEISFEFEAPVARIQKALEELDPSPQRQRISREAQILKETSQRIMEGSKSTLAEVPVDLQEAQLKPLVEKVVEFYHLDPPGVVLLDRSQSAKVRIDARKFQSVLHNVIENAVKFSSRQQKHVEVLIEVDEQHVLIKIKDYGIGISPEDQPKLFSPFFKAEESGRSLGSGLGLGLSLSKKIMVALGGNIEILSEKGKFTEVSIFLTRLLD